MKHGKHAAFALVFPCAGILSCGGGVSTTGDAHGDPYRETHTDAVQDTGEDTEGDVAAPDHQDIVDEDEIPSQGPIAFVIKNTSSNATYILWPEYDNNFVVQGSRTTGGSWDPINYWPPSCREDCARFERGEDCCIFCEAMIMGIRELDGGEEIRIQWDGENIYIMDHDHCLCSCYWTSRPDSMAYRAEACTYASFQCLDEPCTPNDDDIYWNAYGEGEPTCFHTTFTIPTESSEVVIEVR